VPSVWYSYVMGNAKMLWLWGLGDARNCCSPHYIFLFCLFTNYFFPVCNVPVICSCL